MTLHFLNDVANDAESTQKNRSLRRRVNQLGKLINRIPGSCLLYQVNQTRLREGMLNRSASLAMSTTALEALSGKLDIKRY